MKYIRFSIVLGIFALLSASLMNSCRHGSPTGPTDTTVHSDTGCCHGRITLTMYDSATGHALDGGSASLYGNDQLIQTKHLSTTGTVWDGLCPGHYHVVVSKDGYNPKTIALDTLGCNGTDTVHGTLAPETTSHPSDTCCHGVVELTVDDSTTHTGLSGATVVLTNRTLGTSQTRTTSDGSVRFDGLCPGNYLCQITKDGYTTSTFDFLESCNEGQPFTKSLLSNATSHTCDTASITVRIQDSIHRDTYLSGVLVRVRMDGHPGIVDSGYTTDGGYFTAMGLTSPATYILTFSKDGYNEKEVVMQLGDCRNYHETYALGTH